MATYTTLRKGSTGDEVKKLQTSLGIKADGIYGSQTESAVREYQKANGLSTDGIAGNQTLGKLYGNATPTASNKLKVSDETAAADKTRQELNSQKPSDFTYADYEENDIVKQANALLQQQIANKPGEYQSNWQTQLDETLNKILNREKFSYDLNGDALYQQYKDQYMLQGQQAMMDTMGQAQAMTGGYGNSYAQTVGQQAYQGHLQQLNDKVPELYQLALDQYNREGQDLYNQYGLYADRDEQDYGRYRDTVSDYNTELDYLTNEARYQAETDYGRHMDKQNILYTQNRDEVADWQNALNRADSEYWNLYNRDYTLERDAVADSQWQKQHDLSAKSASSSGGSSGSGSKASEKILGGWSEKDFTSAMKEAAIYGDKEYAKQLVISAGGTSAAYEIYNLYFGDTSKGVDTTVDKLTAQENRLHGGRGGSFRVRTTR